jgi:hypothetical protein
VRRGDLPAVLAGGTLPHYVLIVDGEFAQSLSVTATEVRDLIRAGVTVMGASSMGALRAAECWPLGMRGYGWIYGAYRAQRIEADDEVALTFHPRTLAATTVPLVNVRWAAARARRRGAIDAAEAATVVAAAHAISYYERRWELVTAALADVDPLLATRWEAFVRAATPAELDRKRVDAELAMSALCRRLT